jgi:hypothetical protein
MPEKETAMEGSKSWIVTFWLSLVLGLIGVDRFYLGKWKSGLAKAFTLGGFGFWFLFDLYELFIGVTRDKNQNKLHGLTTKKRNFNFALGVAWIAWSLSSFIFLQSLTPDTPRPTSTLSSTAKPLDSCGRVKNQISQVSGAIQGGDQSVSELELTLRVAAQIWATEATSQSGSKAAWLEKMAELALDVDSFMLTGSPYDGELKLDQLFNNMTLYSQFCD